MLEFSFDLFFFKPCFFCFFFSNSSNWKCLHSPLTCFILNPASFAFVQNQISKVPYLAGLSIHCQSFNLKLLSVLNQGFSNPSKTVLLTKVHPSPTQSISPVLSLVIQLQPATP